MPILERLSIPDKGIWHEGMRRKKLEKERLVKEQVKAGVWNTGHVL